jgi:hypothetical protein
LSNHLAISWALRHRRHRQDVPLAISELSDLFGQLRPIAVGTYPVGATLIGLYALLFWALNSTCG